MIVRELIALLGFEVNEQSLLRAENAFETIATAAFKLDLAMQKLGNIGTGAMQELEYAAKQSGLSVEDFGQRMAFFGRAVNEAVTVGGKAGVAFYQMKITNDMIRAQLAPGGGGLPALLGMVADKFNLIDSASKKDAYSMALFARSGSEMIPMLSQGSAGIEKWGAELRKTGAEMSPTMIKQGIELYHLLVQFDYTIKGLTYAIAGPFLKAVTGLITKFMEWIQTHREIIASKIGNVIMAIGHAFEFAAYMVENFTRTMALLGIVLFAAMFPMTAFFAALFLIAEDMYKYFALGNKNSVTYLVILAFEVLKKRLTEMFMDFDPFGFGKIKDMKKALDDWKTGIKETYGDSFDAAYAKAKRFFDLVRDPTGFYSGVADKVGSYKGGFNVMDTFGLWGKLGSGLSSLYSPDYWGSMPGMGGGGGDLHATFNIFSPTGEAGDVANASRRAIDDWWKTERVKAKPR